MQDKVKQLRKTIVQPWGNVLFHHQKIYTTISLSYFTDTETHSRWEKLKLTWYAAQKLADSRKNWNLKVNAFDSYLPYQGLVRRMQADQCLDPYHLLTYKTSPYSRRGGGGGIVLEVLAYCVSSLPGKEIKPLFFLLHKLLSVFLFSISA